MKTSNFHENIWSRALPKLPLRLYCLLILFKIIDRLRRLQFSTETIRFRPLLNTRPLNIYANNSIPSSTQNAILNVWRRLVENTPIFLVVQIVNSRFGFIWGSILYEEAFLAKLWLIWVLVFLNKQPSFCAKSLIIYDDFKLPWIQIEFELWPNVITVVLASHFVWKHWWCTTTLSFYANVAIWTPSLMLVLSSHWCITKSCNLLRKQSISSSTQNASQFVSRHWPFTKTFIFHEMTSGLHCLLTLCEIID